MHPVLTFAILFIVTTTALLFVFEKYQFGSGYLLFLISTITTFVVGKVLIKIFPSEDPMQGEIIKEDLKIRSNRYKREIQLLFNIVQPDPMYQPSPKRLGGSIIDCFDLDANEMNTRLKVYFGDSFDTDLHQPLPDMIEAMKKQYKNWPS